MAEARFPRHKGPSLAGALVLSLGFSIITSAAQVPAKGGTNWVVPRTADGKPDLQGNWSNETQTPLERLGKQGLTLTDEQATALEKRAQLVEEFRDRPSDPNAPPPSKGGDGPLSPPGEKTFVEQFAEAAGGAVGGYNGFWLDPGNKVIRIDGVARSSIIVDPPDGRIPALTAEGKQRMAERIALTRKFGEYDHPEVRPLSDRCIVSFGSNAGPPMLPNYFYNNNYTIVQTKDHVMIMTEMNHDARVVRLGAAGHAPSQVRPWFGDSIGHWEGDTLVVETTNIHPTQLAQTSPLWPYRGASDKLKVTERFTRTGPNVLLYKFTVEDPSTFTAPFSGELPFNRIDELIHEYACHEGNYALPGILAGARAEEQAKKQ
ncbi:MAG TPA: hypothetical protein VGD45_01010 [Steroidobacter sp.]|uniref:hypothetical protein n=1 Tax=Steroidobacter sp. TaxID=1978227 RepID=UPI002ED854AF